MYESDNWIHWGNIYKQQNKISIGEKCVLHVSNYKPPNECNIYLNYSFSKLNIAFFRRFENIL